MKSIRTLAFVAALAAPAPAQLLRVSMDVRPEGAALAIPALPTLTAGEALQIQAKLATVNLTQSAQLDAPRTVAHVYNEIKNLDPHSPQDRMKLAAFASVLKDGESPIAAFDKGRDWARANLPRIVTLYANDEPEQLLGFADALESALHLFGEDVSHTDHASYQAIVSYARSLAIAKKIAQKPQ